MTALPKFMRLVAASLVSSCCVAAASWAGDGSARIRDIVNTAIRPVMAEYDIPGMAVAVTIDGQPAYFNYGVASRQDKIPVSEQTLFELGSISKTFTGTLAAYAQASGQLSLQDSPGQYMPQLKGSAIDRFSLLHLGTYTAGGLPLQFPDAIENDGQTTAYFREWQPDSGPGLQRRYSNPSIGLLGHITGLALNSSFDYAMETRLFPALGLNRSYIRMPDSAMADYAWGYDRANKPIRVNPGPFDAQAYGVKSTAADMIRFVQANIDPTRLAGPMQRAIEGTHVGYFKVGDMVQGIGWEQYPYPITLEALQAGNSPAMSMESNAAQRIAAPRASSGPTLFNKTGSTNGFGAYAVFVPAEGIGIVMLANKNFPISARIKAAYAILEQLVAMRAHATRTVPGETRHGSR